jgi:hypothetical protein
MEQFESMELIENNLAGKEFGIAGIGISNGFELRKIYLKERVQQLRAWVEVLFPGVQIVKNIQEITNDNGIELVFISATAEENNLTFLAKIIHTGKHVRVV